MTNDEVRIGVFATGLLVAFGIGSAQGMVGAEELRNGGDLQDKSVTFEAQVYPILQTRCHKCHGDGKTEAGLDLRRRFTMLKGGEKGPAIVPGKPDESLLIQRIEKGEMPPKDEGPLDDKQRQILRRWVAAGAPLAGAAELPLEETEGAVRITDKDRQFWPFRAPIRMEVPAVKAAERVRTPIDAFLLARLEEKGLSFNPDAPKPVLLRRLCFDLLGLPPTPEQFDEFLSDDRTGAYERLVDRLLESPQYGERWARHWLDVAGYADSDGYLAADRLRPEAWRYRDYVIDALNRDLPFDRFVVEQLAGDELSDWRRAEELSPEMIRQLTATGFLRTALDPTYSGYTEPNEIHQVISDTIQIVGSTFLGLTIQCARCHSHKQDPISQRDYYSLQSVFLAAYDPARWQPSALRGIWLASDAQLSRINEHNEKADERLNYLNATLTHLVAKFRKKRVTEVLAGKQVDTGVLAGLVAAGSVAVDKRNDEQKGLIAQYAPQLSLAEADLASQYVEFKDESEKLKAAIASESALKKKLTLVRGLADLDDKPPQGHLLRRGDYNKPGSPVDPGVPEILSPAGFKLVAQAGYKTTGRRTALAQWLTDPANPQTARVHVNRVWARHFGRGLIATQANFGRMGARPSHPELLDWLATEFIRLGWSQKALHRLMLNSTAYRQSSDADPAKTAVDPDNVLLGAWQPRRVEGEVIRDSVLAVAGKLNPAMFGPPSPVAPQPDGSVVTADDPAGNRRSVYLIVRRSQHLTMFDLFDTPMMEINCPERSVSIVPLQALAMFHGPFAERGAVALADRVLRSESDDEARVGFVFRLLFARDAGSTERQAVRKFLESVTQEHLGAKAPTDAERQVATRAAWTQAALVLLNSSEFLYVH